VTRVAEAALVVWGLQKGEGPLRAGELVEVKGRHGPGMNKEGGQGWILKVVVVVTQLRTQRTTTHQ
jgi:hypothetical protein